MKACLALLLMLPSATACCDVSVRPAEAARWLVGHLVEPSCAGNRSTKSQALPPQVSWVRLYGVLPPPSLYSADVVVTGRPTTIQAAHAWCRAEGQPAAWQSTSVNAARLLAVDWSRGAMLMRVSNPLPIAIRLGLEVDYEQCGKPVKHTLKIPGVLVAPATTHTFTVESGRVAKLDDGLHEVVAVKVTTSDPRVVWDFSTPVVMSDQCTRAGSHP